MEDLYREYRSPMLSIARSILRDEGLAEDAVQQAFLKLFQNFEKIPRDGCNKTRSFIVIIIRNTAIDLYRRRSREKVISFEELEVPLPAGEDSPELLAEAGETSRELAEYLGRMAEKDSSLLMLRYYHGCPNKEIAQLLGMTQAQVAMGLYRAKQRLLKMMRGGETDEHR